tara:strand:+ start:433 stop:819 length:387 start_codon:yes stop_codon:yes gene_type:complete
MNYNIFLMDYILLPLSGIYTVKTLSNNYDFTYKLYENNFIIIDYWFLIHIINTNIIIFYYPYNITIYKFWYFVFGWEFIENILIPNTFNSLKYFKEDYRDTFGDIVAALAAFIILYFIKKRNTQTSKY